MVVNIGKIFICLVLLGGLLLVGRHLKKHGTDPDERKAAYKAIAYLAAALGAVILFVHALNGVGMFFGIVFALILIATVLLALVNLPTHMGRWDMSQLDALLWRDSFRSIPYIRWARRCAMLLFLLFVFIVGIIDFATAGSSDQTATGNGSGYTAPPTTAPAVITSPQATVTTTVPETTTTAPSVASTTSVVKDAENNCSGPHEIPPATTPKDISFDTENLAICYNGKWQSWTAVSSTTPPPQTVHITNWTVEGTYGYGAVTDPATGDSYIIQTSVYS